MYHLMHGRLPLPLAAALRWWASEEHMREVAHGYSHRMHLHKPPNSPQFGKRKRQTKHQYKPKATSNMSNSLGMTFFGPSGWTKPRHYHTSPFDKDSSDKVLQELPILFSGLSFAEALGREEDLHGEYHGRWVSPTLWNHLSHDISLVN